MGKKAVLIGISLLLALISATGNWGMAVEKVRLGMGVKASPHYNLTWMAAEEKGLWKENGLEAEIVLFVAATPLLQAMAAKHIDVGFNSVPSIIEAAVGGAPLVIVAHLITKGAGFSAWVKADSAIKEAKELRGAKIGVTALGSTSHAYGRVMARALGLEKEIKFVGVGGMAPLMAALKAGRLDGMMITISPLPNLLAAGEVRSIFSVADYLPKKWVEHVVVVRKDYLDGKGEVVRKAAKVFSEATRFAKENPKWAMTKLKGPDFLFTDKAAQIVFNNLIANLDFGKIDKEGLENVRNFLVEYGIVAKEKAPPVDAVYRNIFD